LALRLRCRKADPAKLLHDPRWRELASTFAALRAILREVMNSLLIHFPPLLFRIASRQRRYHGSVKAKPEYVEGPEAWKRFDAAMHKVLSVPHDELQRRIALEREASLRNPHRRGPKPKSRQKADS
jgi:hypothetical protein